MKPKTDGKSATTMNKATFMMCQNSEDTVPTEKILQTQKGNGQALYMHSRPKIKQFFQNLSCTSSQSNLRASKKNKSDCFNSSSAQHSANNSKVKSTF